MPQTWPQWIAGYIYLIFDTLTQRLYNLFIHADDDVFTKRDHLHGQVAIVTGANTGIGYETTRHLSRAGAHVILACRNVRKGQEAIERLTAESSDMKTKLSCEQIDLSDLSSVRRFADVIEQKYEKVDMLILNGGVMAVPHNPQRESHFFINHVSHALLALLLLPSLSKSTATTAHAGAGRIVFVSSITAAISNLDLNDLHFQKRPYQWMTAYANSKLAMILFMYALNLRLCSSCCCNGSSGNSDGKRKIFANAVHPGESASDVARHMGQINYFLHKTVGPFMLLSVSDSARTSVYAAGSSAIQQGGLFLHRINRPLTLAPHLTSDTEIQQMWQTTLKLAKVSKQDMDKLQPYVTF